MNYSLTNVETEFSDELAIAMFRDRETIANQIVFLKTNYIQSFLHQMRSIDRSIHHRLNQISRYLSSEKKTDNYRQICQWVALSLPLVITLCSPQIARADCLVGTADTNIYPYISGEVYGTSVVAANVTNRGLAVDSLDDLWRTAAGLPQTGTIKPWFGTATTPVGSASTFTTNGVVTTVKLVDLKAIDDCTWTDATTGANLDSSNTMQGNAPRPGTLDSTANQPRFWNENGGITTSRNAVLFEFAQPVSAFGAWFGDLETRTTGTLAIVRLYDTSGNQIGTDIPVTPSTFSNNGSAFANIDQTTCGISSVNGCGNNATRWVGFVDGASSARVKRMLVVVGDSVAGGNGYGEHISFIGADILAANPGGISGKVFEDVNYGGGSGRPLSTVGAVLRDGVTVELYLNGSYVSSTVTSVGGKYTFPNLAAGNYQVRVVNSTVTSSRLGYVNSLIPVQTFRTTAINGTAIDDVDRVGGEIPSEIDAPPRTGSQTLADLNALTGREVQSIAPVTVGSSIVSGVDFGFNFDTIVNTNDTGQGSLRQFILNANALDNTGLAQVGQSPGKEVSILMISDGNSHPGLRPGLTSQLINGVAVIANTSSTALVISGADTSLDATTQTTNVGDTNLGTQGGNQTVGTDGLTLAPINKPEVELKLNKTLQVTGNRVLLRGFAVYNNTSSTINWNGGSNGEIDRNFIGSTATSFSDPGIGNRTGTDHIVLNGAIANMTITNNLVGFATGRGILFNQSTQADTVLIQGNQIDSNNRAKGTAGGGIELLGGYTPTTGGYVKNITIKGNLIAGHIGDNGIELQDAVADTGILIDNNTISTNNFGLYIAKANNNQATVSHNIITSNSLDGIVMNNNSGNTKKTFSQNSIYSNGRLGINLNNPGVSANDGIIGTQDNNGIDYPVITYTTLSNGTLTVKGFVGKLATGSTSFAQAKLEFFIALDDGNQNGEVILADGKSQPHGEGKIYLGNCTSDDNGLFGTTAKPCFFPNAGTLGLTNRLNITATATDPDGNTSEFSAIPSFPANIEILKRITGIKAIDSNYTTITAIDNTNPDFPKDYITGTVDGGKLKPGDEIEYTIYFINKGGNPAKLKICDPLDRYLIFNPDGFGTTNSDLGIQFQLGQNSPLLLTSANNPTIDRASYLNGAPPPSLTGCNILGNTAINLATASGTIIVDVNSASAADTSIPTNLLTIPGITSSSVANDSYGWLKFRAKVRN